MLGVFSLAIALAAGLLICSFCISSSPVGPSTLIVGLLCGLVATLLLTVILFFISAVISMFVFAPEYEAYAEYKVNAITEGENNYKVNIEEDDGSISEQEITKSSTSFSVDNDVTSIRMLVDRAWNPLLYVDVYRYHLIAPPGFGSGMIEKG